MPQLRTRSAWFALAAAAGAITIATACQSSRTDAPLAPAVQIETPSAAATAPVQFAGLHNVVCYGPDLLSGGVPEGNEGLETLHAMGVKTILSVDGGTPDVAGAARLGMRYVHLPVSYDTVTPQRQQQLAQAIANCEGPIYVHCHHGKHRSAAALASAVVLAGKLTPEQAQERMGVSGTAKEYTGLWQVVREAKPMPAEALKVDPKSLPSVTKVSGMVATMAEIDQVIDLVKQSHQAGWQAPSDHPDLVATKETKRLHTLFANLQHDVESRELPADYQARLTKVIAMSEQLDAAVRAGQAPDAEKLLTAINKSCKECHVAYRDK